MREMALGMSFKRGCRMLPPLTYWRLLGCLLMPLILSPIIFTSDTKSSKAGYLLLLMTAYLVLELLPIVATILLVLFMIPAVGLATTSETARYFMNDTMFLFISVLVMAISIEEVNLHNRLALLALRAIGVSPSRYSFPHWDWDYKDMISSDLDSLTVSIPHRLILGFLIISGFLSMWMSNFAVTLMILPIASAVTETLTPDRVPLSRSSSRRGTLTMQELEESMSRRSSIKYGRRVSTVSINPFSTEMLLAAIHEHASESTNDHEHDQDKETTGFLNGIKKDESAEVPVQIVVTDVDKATEKSMLAPVEKEKNLTKAFQLSIAYGANIGGMATLIGAYNNMLLRMTMEGTYGTNTKFNFLSFTMVAAPIVCASLLVTWIIFCLLYVPGWLKNWKRLRSDSDVATMKTLNDKLRQLGPVSHGEISVLVVFGTVITLWLSRDPKVIPGWGSLFLGPEFATDAIPVLLGACVLFIIPLDFKAFFHGTYKPVLLWKNVVGRLPWEFVLFAGCMMALIKLSEIYGLIDSLGSIVPDLRGVPPVLVMFVVSLFAAILSEVMGGGIIAAILLPIFANIAENTGVNPLYYMMAIALSTQIVFLTPLSSFPALIVYNSGTVTFMDIVKSGIGPKIICLALQILSLEFLGWLIMDLKVFPDWAQQRLLSRSAAGLINATFTTTALPTLVTNLTNS